MPSLRAGNTYQYNINPSGHHSMFVHNADGSVLASYPTATSVNAGLSSLGLTGSCSSGDGLTQEGTRFTQHPDFATFFISQSKANPILVRLPDMAFVYIEDGLSCSFVGDMDAVFPGPTEVPRAARPAPAPGGIDGARSYSIDGRRFHSSASGKARSAPGLLIVRNGARVAVKAFPDGYPAALYPVLSIRRSRTSGLRGTAHRVHHPRTLPQPPLRSSIPPVYVVYFVVEKRTGRPLLRLR